ncbi:hypothetical protein [Sphingomonas sp.]|uniref:hypothetical protein n=1 Tax=Sphingomonas sp. TaxID=28214 RepID=UPI003D6C7A62
MTDATNSYLNRPVVHLSAAGVIGLAVVTICNVTWALARGLPISTLWDAATPVQVLLAAFPYIVLALLGIRTRRSWVVGLVLTTAFWGFYLFTTLQSYGGGANIGLGLLMMLSPLVILAASLLAPLSLARGQRGDNIIADY